jgi:hypothetical protein
MEHLPNFQQTHVVDWTVCTSITCGTVRPYAQPQIFKSWIYTAKINTCCNFGHVTMHVVCGTHRRQKLQQLKNLHTIPLACIELLH